MDDIRAVGEAIRRACRALGPYLLLELLMPGGTLLALTLFLYRRWKRNGAPRWMGLVPAPILIPAKVGR